MHQVHLQLQILPPPQDLRVQLRPRPPDHHQVLPPAQYKLYSTPVYLAYSELDNTGIQAYV